MSSLAPVINFAGAISVALGLGVARRDHVARAQGSTTHPDKSAAGTYPELTLRADVYPLTLNALTNACMLLLAVYGVFGFAVAVAQQSSSSLTVMPRGFSA